MAGSWKNLFTRAYKSASADNIGLISAGVAYYAFLAIVPLLAAAVLSYGLFVDEETVAVHIQSLATMLPGSATGLIGDQLEAVVQTSSGAKGIGLALALAIALFGARNGAGSIVTALGIAYDHPDERSFLRSNLLAIAITIGAVVGAGLVVAAMSILAAFEEILPSAGGAAALLSQVVTYFLLLAAAIGGAAALFRYGPDRPPEGWRAVRFGAIFTGAGWVVLTLLFGIYVANFGSYNATYGALGAVVVLLTWLYLSAYVLLFGAELNAARNDSRTETKTNA